MRRFGLAAGLVGLLLALGCGSTQPGGDIVAPLAPQPMGPVGTIRGVVRFQAELPVPEFDPITENQDVCGERALLPRLELGADNGVRHAFVYLEGVDGPPAIPPAGAVLVDQRECEYVPHALVVPAGTQLEVTNSDSILHNVHGRGDLGSGMQTLFNIAQPVQGQRTRINSPLTEPGIIVMSCEAGHPWMKAHLFVADHPYVTVTNSEGGFVLENVPPGTYTIRMWHEGVRLERIVRSLQRYDYEDPYEISREVSVEANVEAVIDFELELRPSAPLAVSPLETMSFDG